MRWLRTAALLALLAAAAVAAAWLATYGRAIRQLASGSDETVFLDASGAPWFALDARRRYVPLQRIAPALRQAVVAVEDRRFYRHFGVDPAGVARALVRNLRSGRVVEGGSTITQQLARTLFLSRRRSLERKLKESALALLLEALLTKDRILELYLNRVPLGGVHGVEAFALEVLGKPAAELSLAESALVAGVIRAPTTLSPAEHPDRAFARSRVVLAGMRRSGFIDAAAEERAARERPRILKGAQAIEEPSAYARNHLRQIFREEVGDEYPVGWRIRTTVPAAVQRAADAAVARGLARLGAAGAQAALVALDPATGDLLAMVGGADYGASPFNRAVQARRQPGSAFKPVVYAAALARGDSPVTRLSGVLSTGFAEAVGADQLGPGAGAGDEAASVTYREALYRSDNEAALALQQRIGTDPVLALARGLGLGEQPAVASLALGTGGATPLEITAAFAAFANGGRSVRPRALRSIADQRGRTVFEDRGQLRAVLPPPVAFQVLTMLRDVVERGTGAGARELGFPVAGKTGTTDGYRDAWFVGFSSTMVAGVWVGRDRAEPIGDEAWGSRVALPIWTDFMRRAAAVRPPGSFVPPPGLKAVELCRVSFESPSDRCPTYTEYFKDGDAMPERLCPLHQGSFRQRVARAVGGLIDRIRGLFRRR